MRRQHRPHGGHPPEANQLDLFRPTAQEPHWLRLPEETRETAMNLMARLLDAHARLHCGRGQATGGRRDD
jgi:hypothetical protein